MKRLFDLRGNSKDRKRRRDYLISIYGNVSNNTIRCFHCDQNMIANSSDWQVDRYPVCGHSGGRYTRDNIVPACEYCNISRCNKICLRN